MQSISRTEATSDRDPPGELRVRQRSARLVTSPYIAGVENLDDARWLAVQQRDATSAGLFVYAVRTTGVYCRSGCGARRALRANVEFFATGDEAAAAGYRPCQKCRPDRPETLNPSLVAVIAACRWLEQPGTHDVARFAASLRFSERHLRRR